MSIQDTAHLGFDKAWASVVNCRLICIKKTIRLGLNILGDRVVAGREEKDKLIEHILELEEKAKGAFLLPREWLSVDLTMPQLKTMLLLFSGGPIRMSALSSSLGISLATTTGIVERLVKQGFVQRESQPGDRRVVVCKLTQEGQEVMSRLWESKQIWARSLLNEMTPSQLKAIAKTMEAVQEATARMRGNSTKTNSMGKSPGRTSKKPLSSERRI